MTVLNPLLESLSLAVHKPRFETRQFDLTHSIRQ